ncbi:uncharacterized protein LOC132731984 [Ruditapes philippinarum]|uniref:uncharacterized protein LOC132731984 n=1 Tax=Ruditapes philippinarum TaxID=129788 RepID=UPI00295A9918|nr:uncharacterized protein LOC132731984 [Ruditapes philippinarum]
MHQADLDNRYKQLCSANVPFTDKLYGDDVCKNVKEIQDMSRVGKQLSVLSRFKGPRRGRPYPSGPYGNFRGRGRGRGGRYQPLTSSYTQAPKKPQDGSRQTLNLEFGRQMSAEGTARQSRLCFNSSSVGNAEFLSSTDEYVDRQPGYASTREHFIHSEHQQSTSVNEEITSDSLSAFRRSFQSKNISVKSTNIILASWRKDTKKQYVSYINRWTRFCNDRQINSVQTDLNFVLDFLTSLYDSGCGYSAINTARSALSAIGIVKDGFSIGSHPIVIRYMKGIFNLRPSVPKYCETWDVSSVLAYLRKLSPVSKLSLKLLTLKLCMLIALTLASRVQSIYLLDIKDMRKCSSSYILQYSGLLKQCRAGLSNPVAELKSYPPDRRLCVVFVLNPFPHEHIVKNGHFH